MKFALGIVIALLFSGCVQRGERIKVDQVPLPASYKSAIPASGGDISESGNFGSSELTRLLREASEQSPDLLSALERAKQAEYALKGAYASNLPSLNLSGRTSLQSSNMEARRHSGNASLAMSYDLDLFGRNSALRRALEAGVKVSEYDVEYAKLTLFSAIMEGYFRYLGAKEQIALTKEEFASAQKTMQIIIKRHSHGAVSALDVSLQKGALLAKEATLLSLELRKEQYFNALAILLGSTPQDFRLETSEHLGDLKMGEIKREIPSRLLVRRPDVASALARIEVNEAHADEAYAALFPSFSLTLSGTLSNTSSLLSNPSRVFSASLDTLVNLFDRDKLKYTLLSEKSKIKAALQNYRKVLLEALKEVEDASVGILYYAKLEHLQEEQIAQARHSFEIASARYQEGAIDIVSLLETQRSLFSAQKEGIELRLSRLLAYVALYRALGGNREKEEQKENAIIPSQ